MAVRRNVQFLATDIWDTPEDGKRYEVIDGELYVTPPPVVVHQRTGGTLYHRIRSYLDLHPLGEIFVAPIGVILDTGGVQPDLVYVANEHRAIIAALVKSTLLEIGKQQGALGEGLLNAAPGEKSGMPNKSVEYLLAGSEQLLKLAAECESLMVKGQ